VLAVEDAGSPTAADIDGLVRAAASADAEIRRGAIRALGRLERRDVVPHLMPLLRGPSKVDAVFAIAQAMQGPPLDSAGSQVEAIQQTFIDMARREEAAAPLGELAQSLGRLPYDKPGQVEKADEMLHDILRFRNLRLVRKRIGDGRPAIVGALKGAEQLGRRHGKLGPFSDELIGTLRGHATERIAEVGPNDRGPAAHALLALVAVRGLDEDTLRISLRSRHDDVRRIGALALAGGASPITGADRGDALREALRDRSHQVRYEAVRGYARQQAKTDGCQPLAGLLADDSPHVVLAAIDALGDACATDENTEIRLTAEARTPPNVGSWHREAHALVALAKTAPEQARILLAGHARHTVWQVRMYAARAAAILNDTPTLETLALDPHDNVREATLMPLKRLQGGDAERYFVAALGRPDYQLLRTAARELQKMPVTRTAGAALLDALVRITAEKKDTSRDARVAILERLREFGSSDMTERLLPLLRDFDAAVAEETAHTLTAWTGRTYTPDPQPLPRPPLPLAAEILYLQQHDVTLLMADGKRITIRLDPGTAPLNSVRFLRLARANYFNGLTFHRVVPNFVLQGGSPGANEYVGDGPYVRDEIGRRSHLTGTVGLSTRGRDTGDAQIFINLVDNLRLDFDYTVFGEVLDGPIDRILEGDVIRDVRWTERRR
jgi:cyclophilin family peptidyl-prolyl cis-trans isomerase/HEAT repeat protein